jgi:predicted transglutaminase-like cysteine proteinase
MGHPLLVRAILGSAGLAACVALLSEVAKAAGSTDYNPIVVSGIAPVAPPNISGTVTLRVKPLRYIDDWERARRDDSSDPRMQALIAPARGLNRQQQILYIQSAVFQRVHWRSDATEWGYHDYWASAAETLQHGYGDEEDRAIVKMQALRALGFPTRDLYLTMGNDRVGGQITVLIVRLGQRYFMLDDTSGAPFTTEHRPEFTPMLTFGYGGFWIHGYPHVPGAPRPRARTAVATAGSAFAAH